MDTNIELARRSNDPELAAQAAYNLLLQDSRSVATQRAYASDLTDFFLFWTQEAPNPQSLAHFCSLDSGSISLLLNQYKINLRVRELSEATVNRRLAALRSLLRIARRLGASCADPSGLVTGEKVVAYRDTRGPSLDEARLLLSAPDRTTLVGKRDYALLLLLCENALRRGEIESCNVMDFDRRQALLWIYGKGKGTQRQSITLSATTATSIDEYLAARENVMPQSPLFCNVWRGRHSEATDERRLTGRGIFHIVNSYGEKVLGRPLRPHALRHMAITACLDATSGDVRTAQQLSRHADIRTLTIYDDNREDLQGKATRLLSDLFHQTEEKDSNLEAGGNKADSDISDGPRPR